jgi:hypothetical protein
MTVGRGFKLGNSYMANLGPLYAQTPKAVFAAIAWSMCFINVEEAGTEEANKRFLEEWQALYDNGIVPQAPPKGAN